MRIPEIDAMQSLVRQSLYLIDELKY
jgi:hypothetical protein